LLNYREVYLLRALVKVLDLKFPEGVALSEDDFVSRGGRPFALLGLLVRFLCWATFLGALSTAAALGP